MINVKFRHKIPFSLDTLYIIQKILKGKYQGLTYYYTAYIPWRYYTLEGKVVGNIEKIGPIHDNKASPSNIGQGPMLLY